MFTDCEKNIIKMIEDSTLVLQQKFYAGYILVIKSRVLSVLLQVYYDSMTGESAIV